MSTPSRARSSRRSALDALPEGNLIVLESKDVPGIVGSVGKVLGDHMINIGEMTWGRRPADNAAMTIINVATIVLQRAFDELAQLPSVVSVQVIRLSPPDRGHRIA